MIDGEIEALGREECEVLLFAVAGHTLAAPAISIREIVEPLPVSRLPGALPFVEGVVTLRDQAVPVIDLRARLEADPSQGESSQLLVVRDGSGERSTCVRVDGVLELRHLTLGEIAPPPHLPGGLAPYLLGILPRDATPLLDLTALLDSAARARLHELMAELPGASGDGGA